MTDNFLSSSGPALIDKYMQYLHDVGPAGSDEPQQPSSPPATFDDRWNAVVSDSDPFAAAAQRIRRSVHIAPKPADYAQNVADLGGYAQDAASMVSPLAGLPSAIADARDGNYIDAAANLAPGGMRLAGKGIKAAVRTVPKLSAAIAGLLGAGVTTELDNAQGDEKDWWRTPREPMPTQPPFTPPTLAPEEEAQFVVNRPKGWDLRKPGEGPLTYKSRMDAAAKADEAMANRRGDFLNTKISGARQDYDKAISDAQNAYQSDQDRLDKQDLDYKNANQSFREAHPALSAALPYMGAAGAGVIPYAARLRNSAFNSRVVDQMYGALERAKDAAMSKSKSVAATSARKAAAEELKDNLGAGGLDRLRDEHAWSAHDLAKALGGTSLTAELGVLPYQIDQSLPEGSHGRQEADDWRNWAHHAAVSVLPGVGGSYLGFKLPLVRSEAIPPVSEMRGALAGLTQAKTKGR